MSLTHVFSRVLGLLATASFVFMVVPNGPTNCC